MTHNFFMVLYNNMQILDTFVSNTFGPAYTIEIDDFSFSLLKNRTPTVLA